MDRGLTGVSHSLHDATTFFVFEDHHLFVLAHTKRSHYDKPPHQSEIRNKKSEVNGDVWKTRHSHCLENKIPYFLGVENLKDVISLASSIGCCVDLSLDRLNAPNLTLSYGRKFSSRFIAFYHFKVLSPPKTRGILAPAQYGGLARAVGFSRNSLQY
jgi:hypothetical protein